MNNWQLQRVDTTDWIKDTSGIYCIIYWDVKTDTVRIDFMSDNHEPLVSFQGDADNVRKHCMRWLSDNIWDSRQGGSVKYVGVSLEHAAYIGSELEKADTMRIDYVQDGVKVVTSDNPFDVPASVLLRNYAEDNKQKAEDITEKYSESCYMFMVMCNVARWNTFTKEIDSTTALACSHKYYLHECPDTCRVFLCERSMADNIIEILNVKVFQDWLNSNDR